MQLTTNEWWSWNAFGWKAWYHPKTGAAFAYDDWGFVKGFYYTIIKKEKREEFERYFKLRKQGFLIQIIKDNAGV